MRSSPPSGSQLGTGGMTGKTENSIRRGFFERGGKTLSGQDGHRKGENMGKIWEKSREEAGQRGWGGAEISRA